MRSKKWKYPYRSSRAAIASPSIAMLTCSSAVHKDELDSIVDFEQRKNRLVELNAQEQ